MKSKGQQLYEHKYPSTVLVVPASHRLFATAGDAFSVPTGNTAWRFLTKRCQESWERTAEGHYLFS